MNWDYIAGFFDGEGSAYINNQSRAHITFVNTHIGTLEEIQKFIDGGKLRQNTNGERIWYELAFWRVDDDDLKRIIPELQSRCIIKSNALEKVWHHSKDKRANPQGHIVAQANNIFKWYHKDKLSGYQIAKRLNCDPTSIYYVLKREQLAKSYFEEDET